MILFTTDQVSEETCRDDVQRHCHNLQYSLEMLSTHSQPVKNGVIVAICLYFKMLLDVAAAIAIHSTV